MWSLESLQWQLLQYRSIHLHGDLEEEEILQGEFMKVDQGCKVGCLLQMVFKRVKAELKISGILTTARKAECKIVRKVWRVGTKGKVEKAISSLGVLLEIFLVNLIFQGVPIVQELAVNSLAIHPPLEHNKATRLTQMPTQATEDCL
jgi:hypothetical protein